MVLKKCGKTLNKEDIDMVNTSSYINLNTRSLTSNIKNTAVKDKTSLGFMSDQLNPVEDLEKVLKTPINLSNSTNINRADNSVSLAAGTKINVGSGYILTITSQGVQVSGGEQYNQEAWEEAQNMATALATLLRNAGGTMNTVAYSTDGFQKWTDNVSKVMEYLGIDASNGFTVNGVKYSTNDNGHFESEVSTVAKAAYERLRTDNMTYQLADDTTRKRIEYMENHYLADLPEKIIRSWDKALEKTGTNPFALGNSSTLVKASVEQDYTTGGNDRIFGNSVDSVISGIDQILERIENQLAKTDSNYLNNEMNFYTEWKKSIIQANIM